jgi:hypothetical protein
MLLEKQMAIMARDGSETHMWALTKIFEVLLKRVGTHFK